MSSTTIVTPSGIVSRTGFIAAPASLGAIAARVDGRVSTLMDVELARWTAIDATLAKPLAALKELLLAPGKRLRPAFCHWAYVGVGGDPDDPGVIDAGAGLELLHTFALVHDDIMDGSRTRRGLDAIHVQFGEAHRQGGWRGEQRRYGENVAILVGDLAFVYADLMMRNANAEAHAIFTELRIEVNIGQYLDLVGSAQGEPSLEAARRICQYKSGKYTVERPLHLGAALGGHLPRVEQALTNYGMPLGEAFQLRDDLLGAVGDDTLTGKPVGDDLREGKPTALVARAWSSATSVQRTLLRRVGDPQLSVEEIGDLQEILMATGAVSAVEGQIDVLRNEAIAAIASAGLTAAATEALIELAHFVTTRNH